MKGTGFQTAARVTVAIAALVFILPGCRHGNTPPSARTAVQVSPPPEADARWTNLKFLPDLLPPRAHAAAHIVQKAATRPDVAAVLRLADRELAGCDRRVAFLSVSVRTGYDGERGRLELTADDLGLESLDAAVVCFGFTEEGKAVRLVSNAAVPSCELDEGDEGEEPEAVARFNLRWGTAGHYVCEASHMWDK